MVSQKNTALVLFSGGQDSATCLAWACARFDHLETLGFEYGQRHDVELSCRQNVLAAFRRDFPAWGAKLGEDHFLDASVLADIGETALTSEAEIAMGENGLPTTFVPGRNILFFTLAGALAYRRGIAQIVAGVCETDYSGYPDCRNETVKAMEETLCKGMDIDVTLNTPLMWIDKAATWALALEIGGQALIELILEETHTCYRGDRNTRFDWGYGCGTCPACILRAEGYTKYCAER